MNSFSKPFDRYDAFMNYPTVMLEVAITKYNVCLWEEHYVTEAVKKSLGDRVKEFFVRLKLALQNFMTDLNTRIEYTIREKELKRKLKEMRDEIKEKKELGQKEIEILDFWNYRSEYIELNRKLSVYAKKFVKVKYTKTYQIDQDMEQFNNLIDEYSERMEDAAKKTITVPIMKALDFVEDEIRGSSAVLKTLNDCMREFQEMQKAAEELQTKMNLLGADVIPKHVGFIQKIASGISKFVRNFVTKFIVGVIFIFA